MAEPRRSSYVSAGVDVDAGEQAVELMRAAVESTRRPEVIGGLGGFGGAVTIPAGYREPVLVSSTDGVGTKTAIAAALGRYDTIGIDLVAMCVDDVVCSGAILREDIEIELPKNVKILALPEIQPIVVPYLCLLLDVV